MAQCTNRKELLQCSNIALNEIQTYHLIRKDCLWTSNGYREQTKDFDIPASQKDWTKYPDSSWAGVLVDATNRVGCYYVVNIAAKTGKTWYVEISNNIR